MEAQGPKTAKALLTSNKGAIFFARYQSYSKTTEIKRVDFVQG